MHLQYTKNKTDVQTQNEQRLLDISTGKSPPLHPYYSTSVIRSLLKAMNILSNFSFILITLRKKEINKRSRN